MIEQPIILVVEDDPSIRKFVQINLERGGFTVVEAASGEAGIDQARQHLPVLVVLDVMLPGQDGFQICQQLRKEFPNMAILMLTARGQDLDKVMGLELGADDYMVKPFNPLELVARVNAILRRVSAKNSELGKNIIQGEFTLDTRSQRLYKLDQVIELTPKEWALLKVFMENPDRAYSRHELLDLVWGLDYFGDTKIVDVNIRRIREKIEVNPSVPVYIQTVWGTGYRWSGGR